MPRLPEVLQEKLAHLCKAQYTIFVKKIDISR